MWEIPWRWSRMQASPTDSYQLFLFCFTSMVLGYLFPFQYNFLKLIKSTQAWSMKFCFPCCCFFSTVFSLFTMEDCGCVLSFLMGWLTHAEPPPLCRSQQNGLSNRTLDPQDAAEEGLPNAQCVISSRPWCWSSSDKPSERRVCVKLIVWPKETIKGVFAV